MMQTVEIHNTKKENENVQSTEKVIDNKALDNPNPSGNNYCSLKQILCITLPITGVLLFAAIFIPIYVVSKNNEDEEPISEEYDEYEENIVNITYAILTPKGGYNNILIFLGGISDVSDKYFDFFKSKSTFVPKGTKIYFLSGQPREMQFIIDYYSDPSPVPGWFNIDSHANLIPNHDFTEAQKSLKLVLDEIDRIKIAENVEYKNIYLSGFSQGGMMTNYVLLNSRHQLGGYIAFSGYVFDHDFSENTIIYKNDMTDIQKSKLQSRKDYHILATHSFMDNAVFYQLSAESYRVYYSDYTDFKLLSFAALPHVLREQPVHPFVKKWLKESMGK